MDGETQRGLLLHLWEDAQDKNKQSSNHMPTVYRYRAKGAPSHVGSSSGLGPGWAAAGAAAFNVHLCRAASHNHKITRPILPASEIGAAVSRRVKDGSTHPPLSLSISLHCPLDPCAPKCGSFVHTGPWGRGTQLDTSWCPHEGRVTRLWSGSS